MELLKQAEPNGQVSPGEERRRSQRVTLRINVTIHWPQQGKPGSLKVFTVSVNDHGAMLVSARYFAPQSCFELEHNKTQEKIGCRVTRAPQRTSDGFQVPVEFDHPAPGFWKITFPPTDWQPPES